MSIPGDGFGWSTAAVQHLTSRDNRGGMSGKRKPHRGLPKRAAPAWHPQRCFAIFKKRRLFGAVLGRYLGEQLRAFASRPEVGQAGSTCRFAQKFPSEVLTSIAP
uniref:Uncharacterized protein n=1 Tax=Trichuris muris TaxID=70415 RepID=A0A5S6QCD9_TRIMR